MDPKERLEKLWSLYQQLNELITPEERKVYPFMIHLGDLIEDLDMDD
jgi:hypothetical protein